MKRVAAWAASIAFLTAGLVSALGAMSLLRPATNPVSEAAPGFQASVFQGTALAAVLFFLAEAVAWRWSAPAGGWRWGWLATRSFRMGIGALWLALGVAGCAFPFARRGPKPAV